ncbi:MAG: hypothetical protein JSV65_18845 [Armatimonadota bacterium]|nr:MAG: hypothetical protein JSV65_18845 [Armatimonadota bacterium]
MIGKRDAGPGVVCGERGAGCLVRRLVMAAGIALAVVLLLGTLAGAETGERIAPASLYDELRPVFDQASAGMFLIHGREATGVGPGLEWRVFEGCDALRFSLIAARSSTGSERLIPGIGVQLAGGGGTPDVTLGLCWPPSEYGKARIGGVKTYVAPYVGLRVEW